VLDHFGPEQLTLALLLQQALLVDKTLGQQIGQFDDFAAVRPVQMPLGADNRLSSIDLLIQLVNTLLQHGNLAQARTALRVEHTDLALARFATAQLVGRGQRFKNNLGQAVPLCNQPGLHRFGGNQLPASHLVFEAQRRIVENDQRVIRFDNIAVMHQHLLDDAAFKVLHRFAIRLHGHHTGCIGGTIERCECSPDAKHTKSQQYNGKPQAPDFSIAGGQFGKMVS